jgi:FkbM family methyltransferase
LSLAWQAGLSPGKEFVMAHDVVNRTIPVAFSAPPSSDVSQSNWERYIQNKFNFYVREPAQTRRDTEFPWQILSRRRSLRSRMSRVPIVNDAHKWLTRKRTWQELANRLPRLYEARSLLDDELSRLYFDEALILRAVSQGRFFLPRTHFDPFVTVVKEEPFCEPGYSRTYSGLPLKEYALVLEPTGRAMRVIGAADFDTGLNQWRQYLISRGGVHFWPQPGDVVVDCGTCIGDMSVIFAGLVGPQGHVHGFDPVPLHNRFCALQASRNPDLSGAMTFNQLAVGKEVRKVGAGGRVDCQQISPGGLQVDTFDVTTLDSYVDENKIERVDFIKMDVEGAEEDSLIGAEATIRRFKPKLAISTYHRPDDFWSLPLQIKKINPSYRFAFEHHSPLLWESVIYAYQP